MSNVVLDYAFKVTASPIIPSADTSWLKNPAVVVKATETYSEKPLDWDDETQGEFVPELLETNAGIYKITSKDQFAEYTSNQNIESILDVKSYCYLICTPSLDMEEILEANKTNLFTVIISDDFAISDFGEDLANLKVGSFDGVIAYAHQVITSEDQEFMDGFAKAYCSFDGTTNNMCHAFSKLLGDSSWKNQQYIQMPDAGYDNLGKAEYDFEKRVSFVIDDELVHYLGFFAVGGRAIIAPYVIKEITIKHQSKALSWIAANQPSRSIVNAKLLQDRLNEIYDSYISNNQIENGYTEVTINDNDAFSCRASIDITDPTALWRVFGNLTVES